MKRYHSQLLPTPFGRKLMPLLHCCWSISIISPGYFQTSISTSTNSILRSCMTLGHPIVWDTLKASPAHCSTMPTGLGTLLPRRRSCPPAFLDNQGKFPIDSCIHEYWNWTTSTEDRTPPDEHFIWLSNGYTPFVTKPGAPYVPPDFTLGLPAIKDWLLWEGDPPWILDPAKHPKPDWTECPKQTNLPPQKCAYPGSTDNGKRKRRRKKKKHHCSKKPELKVTTWGVGDNVPIWSHTGSATSSSSEDSGLGSYEKRPGKAGSTTGSDHTPRYSPATVARLDQRRLEDDPLSDHEGNSNRDQEMASADESKGAEEASGAIPGQNFTTTVIEDPSAKLEVMPVAPPGTDQPDTDDQKAWRDTFWLILQGFHTATQTLSENYQQACVEVQGIVQRSPAEVYHHQPDFCAWGHGCHLALGPGHTPCYGLYGRNCGEAGTPTARGSESQETDYGGSVGLTSRRKHCKSPSGGTGD